MRDYYTLIARAVSALSDNTADTRNNLYERARTALTSSLIRHNPPISEGDFEREHAALEAGITRVEQQASIGQTPMVETAETNQTGPQSPIEHERSALEAGIKTVEQEASISQTPMAKISEIERTHAHSAEENGLAASIHTSEQQALIDQSQTVDIAKTEPIHPQSAQERISSNGPDSVLPAASPEIRVDRAPPTVLTREPGIQKVEQESLTGPTQTGGTAKTETNQPHPSQEMIAPSEPADALPAVLRQTKIDQGLMRATSPVTGTAKKTFLFINRLVLVMTCVMSVAFAGAIFVKGSSWFASNVVDRLVFAAFVAIISCALGMLPIVRARAPKVGLLWMFLGSSYLLGMITWLLGVLTTLQYWGFIGVVVGLCLAIVGVVPFGVAAATMSADWSMVAMMIAGVLVTYGARDLALELGDG